MNITSINTAFSGKTAAFQNLAQKAEKQLQKRLVDYNSLMRDLYTGDYFVVSTGKKFTGKFAVGTDKFEQLYRTKDGKLKFTLVRTKDGSNRAAGFENRTKYFVDSNVGKSEQKYYQELQEANSKAQAEMLDNFGIKKCLENEASTYIGSRGW